jgi:hypothetical protein
MTDRENSPAYCCPALKPDVSSASRSVADQLCSKRVLRILTQLGHRDPTKQKASTIVGAMASSHELTH